MPHAPDPTCPSCHERLEDGALLDRTERFQRRATFWVPGRPSPGWFVDAKIPADAYAERRLVHAARCPRCGRLELYAIDRPEDV
ncbi:MAG: hypothetical protein IT460_14210 [Planctomycetes bacterium]|nr:hypothetical protein [Planctomycetota bacterium]